MMDSATLMIFAGAVLIVSIRACVSARDILLTLLGLLTSALIPSYQGSVAIGLFPIPRVEAQSSGVASRWLRGGGCNTNDQTPVSVSLPSVSLDCRGRKHDEEFL